MESMGVVVWRYIDYLILLIPTPLVSVFFCSSIPIQYDVYMFRILHNIIQPQASLFLPLATQDDVILLMLF